MTRKESIKELKEVLFKRRDALKSALAGDLSQLRELQASGDIVDLALDTSSDEITSQLAEVEARELANINIAMSKMKSGDYGDCEGCNKAIPLARMQALPYATLCIKCQREVEDGTLDLGYEGTTIGNFQQS